MDLSTIKCLQEISDQSDRLCSIFKSKCRNILKKALESMILNTEAVLAAHFPTFFVSHLKLFMSDSRHEQHREWFYTYFIFMVTSCYILIKTNTNCSNILTVVQRSERRKHQALKKQNMAHVLVPLYMIACSMNTPLFTLITHLLLLRDDKSKVGSDNRSSLCRNCSRVEMQTASYWANAPIVLFQ